MTKTCDGCGHGFDERLMYQMVTGWQRRGHSSVVAKRFEQRWACKPCVEAFQRSGTQWQQMTLL